ncbi:hypothetical protein ACFXNW_28865 [Nocardia sp. NPDC059180]|uniref:hypothetical protein n=1 Tax=Nocardia sp. NPDC059180 TaxID=3346761 RepID=UPI00368FAFB1
MTDQEERDAINAAMDRLFAGTPLRSSGNLDIVSLAQEAGLKLDATASSTFGRMFLASTLPATPAEASVCERNPVKSTTPESCGARLGKMNR